MKAILILSGKGGVGKSSVTAQLALAMQAAGIGPVGVLDIDLCGPSLPLAFGRAEAFIQQTPRGWQPVQVKPGLSLISIHYLLDHPDSPVVWRGPKKTAMIRQFVDAMDWQSVGGCEWLLIDTPPGTSDEHLAILDALRSPKADQTIDIVGAVMVTTPQALSLADVKKEFSFCAKTAVPVLGVVENMCGFVCPHCADCQPVFEGEQFNQDGDGMSVVQRELCRRFQVPLLARLPIDPHLADVMDRHALSLEHHTVQGYQYFQEMAHTLTSDQGRRSGRLLPAE